MSTARHSLYMVITAALVEANARYHLPPYEDMERHMLQHGMRPAGEGSSFMPPAMQKDALKL